jgi:DNA-binding NarL/FixJ family response regulator
VTSDLKNDVMFVVLGRQQLLVTGLIGLLREDGFDACERAFFTLREPQANHRMSTTSVVSVVVMTEDEELAHALPSVRSHTPIVLVSSQRITPEQAAVALLANVIGIVNPSVGVEGLGRALRAAASGRTIWSIEHFLASTQYLRNTPENRPRTIELTQRELEVLQLLHQGQSIREMAGSLLISPKTVEALQRGLYRKLGVRSKIHAVEYALRAGLLP